tara:strand:+ start:31072 stop:32067 length:996 start_codon:yes stop_codon:yes gene_type:complete
MENHIILNKIHKHHYCISKYPILLYSEHKNPNDIDFQTQLFSKEFNTNNQINTLHFMITSAVTSFNIKKPLYILQDIDNFIEGFIYFQFINKQDYHNYLLENWNDEQLCKYQTQILYNFGFPTNFKSSIYFMIHNSQNHLIAHTIPTFNNKDIIKNKQKFITVSDHNQRRIHLYNIFQKKGTWQSNPYFGNYNYSQSFNKKNNTISFYKNQDTIISVKGHWIQFNNFKQSNYFFAFAIGHKMAILANNYNAPKKIFLLASNHDDFYINNTTSVLLYNNNQDLQYDDSFITSFYMNTNVKQDFKYYRLVINDIYFDNQHNQSVHINQILFSL